MKKRSFRNTSKARLSRMSLMGHKKGIEMSINMLVIIALAVFVLFLVIGFVLGGFDFFRKIFFGLSTQPGEVARTKCQADLTSYKNTFGEIRITDTNSDWYKRLCEDRYDVDLNGDTVIGLDDGGQPKDPSDRYSCTSYVDISNIC